jgi:hypothetical protein
MKTLRTARNAETYDFWKKRAEERIRITRGRESLW